MPMVNETGRGGALADGLARPALHILVCVDGSIHSLAGASLVRAMPLPAGSLVTVLGVAPAEAGAGRELLVAGQEQALALLQRDGVEVRGLLQRGPAASRLASLAAAQPPDLVVVGAGGRRAGGQPAGPDPLWSAVQQAQWPVLVARAPATGLRRVLLAYDGSADSQAAAEVLSWLPLPADAGIVSLCVLPGLPAPGAAASRRPPLVSAARAAQDHLDDAGQALLRHGEAMLAEAGNRLKRTGRPVVGWLAPGDPAEAIVRQSAVYRADLVVAGSSRVGRADDWRPEGVTERVISTTRRSVLLVSGTWRPDPARANLARRSAGLVPEWRSNR
jgi:nucleotide-binding universal stress UspA family protein